MTDKEKIKNEILRLKDIQFSLILLCDDLISFIDSMPEEPVGKDLEEAKMNYIKPKLGPHYDYFGDKLLNIARFDGYAVLDAIEFGAKWQKEQMEQERLKHCDGLTPEQAVDKAIAFIVERENIDDYICGQLISIPEENEICSKECENLNRNCIVRFLKHWKEDKP